MKNHCDIEQHRFYFKSTFDALLYVNTRAELANNKYDDLVDKFNNYVVLSDTVDGRISQLVNISTNFGTEDPNDPAVKEFVFNEGSVLRYKRVLPITHRDEYEVVNFKTLANLLTTITGAISDVYVSKTGDSVVGDYTFSAALGGSTITFNGVNVDFVDNTIDVDEGILQTVIDDPLSLINKEYLTDNYTPSADINIQPLFISGKIALHEDNDLLTVRSKGEYDISVLTSAYNEKIICVKLLKFNDTSAWDESDSSWTTLFGAIPVTSIPGYDLPNTTGTIPYPVDYAVYLEYTVDSVNYPYTVITSNSRIRTELHDNQFSPFIDSDGDLSLIGKTDFEIEIPFSSQKISLNCNSSANPVLYLVVKTWSYVPKDELYIHDSILPDPVLLFGNKTWMRTFGTTGDVTIRYRLLTKNFYETITWSDDTALATTYGTDSIGDYVDIVVPIGETIYTVTFTAIYSSSLSKTVSLQLIDYVYDPMSILPTSISYDRYNSLPATYPIDFTCLVSGGQGTKSASIVSDADTTLGSAAIVSDTFRVTGNYITADINEYVKIKIIDDTYALTDNAYVSTVAVISSTGTNVTLVGDTANTPQYSYIIAQAQTRQIASITNPTTFVINSAFSPDVSSASFTIATKTLSSTGVNVTLTNDTIASTPIGSYITVGSETKRVMTTPTSNTLTIESAFAVDKASGTAYTIEIGQTIQKITIQVNELLDNPDETMGKYVEV